MTEYKNKRVLVLGNGLLGRAVRARLEALGAVWGGTSLSRGIDLRDRSTAIDRLSLDYDICLNVAGWNGGLKTNREQPLAVYANNAQIAVNAVEACAVNGVEYLGVLASCGYPDNDAGVMSEGDYLTGRPHESVACHGMAKRAMLEACRFASGQYPMNRFRCVCVPTLWGPGDHFEEGRTKVVGAMVKRMCDAADRNLPSVTCWGTGRPFRDLLYVEDAAELILRVALLDWDGADPLNLSVGAEYSVARIAEEAARAAGYAGEIVWDATMPDGQFRKKLESRRAAKLLGSFRPTPFAEAMKKTAEAYRRLKGDTSE